MKYDHEERVDKRTGDPRVLWSMVSTRVETVVPPKCDRVSGGGGQKWVGRLYTAQLQAGLGSTLVLAAQRRWYAPLSL